MSATREKILNLAETMVKQGGYHAFSFRQIADELGIKSASVHYHFQSKEDLGAAVAARYSDRFFEALGTATELGDPLEHYIGVFESALSNDGRTCLCGVLAAESGRLPVTIQTVVAEFAERNLRWLGEAISSMHPSRNADEAREGALLVFSALEGAMTFSALSGDPGRLHSVGRSLRASL